MSRPNTAPASVHKSDHEPGNPSDAIEILFVLHGVFDRQNEGSAL
jgi:hypothetical protein